MSPNPPLAVVVDADPRVGSLLAQDWAHRGFRSVARRSPEEALEYLRKTRPQVVLLSEDYWMAGWGARFLEASPRSVVVPIVDSAVPAA